MGYDLGFLNNETTRLDPIANPFEAKVSLPTCPELSVPYLPGTDHYSG